MKMIGYALQQTGILKINEKKLLVINHDLRVH